MRIYLSRPSFVLNRGKQLVNLAGNFSPIAVLHKWNFNHIERKIKVKKLNGVRMSWIRFALIALLFPLAGCAVNSAPGTYLVERQGPYTLDTGDVLRIIVYGDDELSDNYTVDDAGNISFPLVGSVQFRGLTTDAADVRLSDKLSVGYLRSPDVSMEIAQYRPFYIQGEVSQSGQYPFVYGMTVRAAISTAGGFNETADRNKVVIYRPNGSEMIKGAVGMDFPIEPGDTIVILDRWI